MIHPLSEKLAPRIRHDDIYMPLVPDRSLCARTGE